MVPRFPVYLFDLDGTLLDSAPDICGAVQTVLARTRQNNVSFEFLRNYIGHHLLDMFQDLLPEMTEEQHWQLIHEYRSIYPARGHRNTKLYEGVAEVIPALGAVKSTATTKSTATARAILEQFGLVDYFNHVQGTDGFPSKPAPDVILRSLEALSVRPEDCLLVGDAGPDIEAAKAAGVRVCAVRWGYGDQTVMAQHGPDFWIDDIRELLS